VLLDLLAGREHQVGQFVGHDDNVRQLLGRPPPLVFVGRLDPLAQLFVAELVVDAHVAHAGAREQLIAFLHLVHGPGQDRLGLTHVGHHRVHQVRQLAIAV